MNNKYILNKKNFLFIDDPIPHSGYFNMEFDKWLFNLSLIKKVKPILRFYCWQKFTITTGRYHKINKEIDIKKCEEMKIPIIKRPTGGRAILHHPYEVTFSFIIPPYVISPFNFRTVFLFVAERLCQGFKNLGINSEINMKPSKYQDSSLCFHSISQYEIVDTNNNKLVGIAQLFKKDSSLIQGSIPFKNPEKDLSFLFYLQKNILIENNLVKKKLSAENIKKALITGFKDIQFSDFSV